MDFGFSSEDEKFRQEVQDFISGQLPPDWTGPPWNGEPEKETEESWQFARDFTYKLQAEKGWLTMHWPKEYGGQGAPVSRQFILHEEIGYWRAPLVDIYGPNMVGPALMNFGTDEQKKEHLPKILGGNVIWTQGFSEPDAGSDLASLRTSAKEEGDHFVVNGQKTWTSVAHYADWMFLLVRTDPQAAKNYQGLSLFYVDMKTPGLTYSPLVNIAKGHTFNEVFFENVRVPTKNMVGQKNQGWYVAMATLDYERSGGAARAGAVRRWTEEFVKFLNDKKNSGEVIANEAIVRDRLAQLAVEAEIIRLLAYRVIHEQGKGRIPTHEASMQHVFSCDYMKRLSRFGTQLLGLYGQLGMESKWAQFRGMLQRDYLYTPGWTLAGGSAEISRNVVAWRGLGLPRM